MPRLVHLRRPIRGRAEAGAQATEDQFERWVLSVARLHGWHGHHTRRSFGVVMGVFIEDAYGLPDWLFSNGRRTIWRELKTELGRISRYQRWWIERLVASGQDAKVWRPRDRQEILETFAA